MNQDSVTVARATRKHYLDHHDEISATTIAALILFDALIADLEDEHDGPFTFLTRKELENRMVKHPHWGSRTTEKKPGNVADLVKAELNKHYRNKKISADGHEWIVSVYGPIAADRPTTSDRGDLALEIEFRLERRSAASDDERIPAVSSDPVWPLLLGRCVCCGNRSAFNVNQRYCDRPKCPGAQSVRRIQDRELLVTIIPERDADYSKLRDRKDNAFVRFMDEPRDSPVGSPPAEYLPYEQDHLAAMGLALGKPLVYRCKRLENWSDFDTVHVLDLAGYRISNTLKDPKSWAVVNCAIEADVSLLVLYTAGNAGLSLAHLLYEAGRLGDRRFRLFSLVEDSLPKSIQMALRAWDCTVVETEETPRYLLEPKTLWKRIEHLLEEENSHHQRRWHVTDGWDGVGVTMYRLMFIEVFRHLHPDFIVMPVGTGNLFTGAHLALTDIYGPDYRPRLVGAVPVGDNVTRDFIAARPLTESKRAITPKLVGRYTPLSPILEHIYKSGKGIFVEVSEAMQQGAGRALFEGTRRDQLPVASEPSALAAPAALKGDGSNDGLWEVLQTPNAQTPFRANASVLVVNSGLGILTATDVEFLDSLF